MSREVAALPFQTHANYGTWSIDFGANKVGVEKFLSLKPLWGMYDFKYQDRILVLILIDIRKKGFEINT